MSKTTVKKTARPQEFVDRILGQVLSNDALYWQVLDRISLEEFAAMEDAVMAEGDADRREAIRQHPEAHGTTAEGERAMANSEVCFRLGLEIGKRIGGAR